MTWINAPIAKCYPMNLGGALPWCCALLLRRPAVRVGRSAWRSFAQRGTSCRSSATCCVRIEWWIGSTSIRLPIGGPSLRPSSQSALLSARCLGGLSHYYAGLDRSLRARPHRGQEVLLPLPHTAIHIIEAQALDPAHDYRCSSFSRFSFFMRRSWCV